MKDTSEIIERRFRAMLLARSGEERLKMGCSMHATAQALVRASVLAKYPDALPAKLKQALFLRFYGNDFEPRARRKIIRALGKAAEHNRKRREKVKEEAKMILGSKV